MKRKWNKLLSGAVCISLALPGSLVYAGGPEYTEDYSEAQVTEEDNEIEVFEAIESMAEPEVIEEDESLLFSASEEGENDVFSDGDSEAQFFADEEPVLVAGESIPIDAAHFPDENFRAFVLEMEYSYGNEDEILSPEEIRDITEIDSCYADDYTGIQYLTSLEEISVGTTDSATSFSLDVSKNIKLRKLSISVKYDAYEERKILENQHINLGDSLSALEELSLRGVAVSSLDASAFPGITELSMENCSIEEVRVSGCNLLSRLYILNLVNNKILEFGTLPALEFLDVSDMNSLHTIQLPTAPNLEGLTIHSKIDEISLSSYPKLESLDLAGNRLKELDLHACVNLEQLDVCYNELTSLDVTGLTNLRYIKCWLNNLSEVKGAPDSFYAYPQPQRNMNVNLFTDILYASQLWDENIQLIFWRGVTISNPQGLTPESTKAGGCSYFTVDKFEGSSTDVSFDLNVNYLDLVVPVNIHLTKAGLTKIGTPEVGGASGGIRECQVVWRQVIGADGYYVYRKINNSKYQKIATLKGGINTYYTDKVNAWAKYSYKIKAYGKVNGKTTASAYSNEASCVNDYQWKPKLTTKTGVKSVALSWKKLNGASGYQIYRSTSKKGKYTKVATIKKGTTVKYTDSKLQAKKTYYYKIRPYLTVGKKNNYGSFSGIVKATVK